MQVFNEVQANAALQQLRTLLDSADALLASVWYASEMHGYGNEGTDVLQAARDEAAYLSTITDNFG